MGAALNSSAKATVPRSAQMPASKPAKHEKGRHAFIFISSPTGYFTLLSVHSLTRNDAIGLGCIYASVRLLRTQGAAGSEVPCHGGQKSTIIRDDEEGCVCTPRSIS